MRLVAPAAAARVMKQLPTGPWKKTCSPLATPSKPSASASRTCSIVWAGSGPTKSATRMRDPLTSTLRTTLFHSTIELQLGG